MLPSIGYTCGWWGDGEMNRPDTVVLSTVDGAPVSEILSVKSAKLPGRMGYGIALHDPGKAVPYLLATFGRQINRIGELKDFGFEMVIDVGTPPDIASKHREETEALGMTYFNIPVKGSIPSPEQSSEFTRILLESGNYPLLVYSPTAPLLGTMWASYRINHGAPLGFAVQEGNNLGMMSEQEAELRRRFELSVN